MRADRPSAAVQDLLSGGPRERLIVALDLPSLESAQALVDRLTPAVRWYKIGAELFTAAGPHAVALVLDRGGRIFLDLKFHDIPHTVAGAVRAALRLGVSMVTVHVAGGGAMMRAAASSRGPAPALVLGVTALTSVDAGVAHVVDLARAAREAGLDGVVAAPREAAAVKAALGRGCIVVTPGIRPSPAPADDQRRTATPAEAVMSGSDFLVVGRPVTAAPDPLGAVEQILDEITRTYARRARESER